MILYFSGGAGEAQSTVMREHNFDQLLSQLNERKKIVDWVTYLREHTECKSHLFIDSGAWSAYSKHKEIDIDDYIKFINEYGDKVTIYASVDKIPGEYGREPTDKELADAPIQSWKNYLYMYERAVYKDKLIPVFHYGEDYKYLTDMLEHRHSDGSAIKYIGLGGVADMRNSEERKNWLNICYKLIKESSNPNVQTHIFGMTDLRLIDKFPITSVDSTTWLKAASYGELIVNCKRVKISERTQMQKGSFADFTVTEVNEFKKLAEKFDMTVEQLQESQDKRLLFNMLSTMDWINNLRCSYGETEECEFEDLF